MPIKNPVEWGVDRFRQAALVAGSLGEDVRQAEARDVGAGPLTLRRIHAEDLVEALVLGWRDFGESRTDVLAICLIYPVAGFVLAELAFGQHLIPLLFPLAAGFALVGPFAAIGMYEMSRRREQGQAATYADAFGVVRSHAFGSILMLGLVLVGLLVLWVFSAEAIYEATLGPRPPATLGVFVDATFGTAAGWAMIAVGVAVGFLFAVAALCISVVSFPLLLDRNVGLERAVWTSVRAVAANPRVMAQWGLVVACGLVLGCIPAFLGLIVVMPVLGHATWHLYRRVVA